MQVVRPVVTPLATQVGFIAQSPARMAQPARYSPPAECSNQEWRIMTDKMDTRKRSQPATKLVWKWLGGLVLVMLAVSALLLLNNNFSLQHVSRESLTPRLESATELGTNWLDANAVAITQNPALVYMVADMANMSGSRRLQHIVDLYLSDPFVPPRFIWRRVVDEKAEVRPPTRAELDYDQEYQRWILYGSAPHLVQLTEAERADMFSPDKYIWGKRTHQLSALLLYRKRGTNTESVEPLINHLCGGIAFEADWDVRVTDLYLQRVAFLLLAGRPDLVKPRWVERILAAQEAEGGWKRSWHGWGPGLFALHFNDQRPTAHATVQGVWTLYMLKYRYPNWPQTR